jgi:hypothetical protein
MVTLLFFGPYILPFSATADLVNRLQPRSEEQKFCPFGNKSEKAFEN